MRRPGLRTRATAGFAASALILSTTMALLSYGLTQSSLLDERERTATRTTYFDASVVQAGLASEGADIGDLLRALDTGTSRRPFVLKDGRWYSRSADDGLTAGVPTSLLNLVASGRPGVQRVRTDSGPWMVFGVPLSSDTAFYEVHSLRELESTLQVLALILLLVGAGTTFAGAALGWYATRLVLRPLASVTKTAQGIAGGDFRARLDPAVEPELRPLTSSFNHMVDELSRRIERDRRFAADVSHELRSPLQTLAAAAAVLERRRTQLDERTAAAAGLITEEVHRFSSLVTDLLELARSDQPAEPTPIDVRELASRVCRTVGVPEAVVCVADDADTIWLIDQRRMEQVLSNLLANAERHGGGAVALRLGHHWLEVDDEGPGVLPEDRTTIFDPFVRGRSANARGDSDGTGLGLALVAQHVAAHGGRVSVVDRPGGGARFRVVLPQEPASVART